MKKHYSIFVYLIFLLSITFYISQNYLQVLLIQGHSMEPTYHHWQPALIDKRDVTYQHGDVIAFYAPELNHVLIKRIVAVPNDTIVIQNNTLYVNNTISEWQLFSQPISDAGIASNIISLNDAEYFVLGDNYSQSKDSRHDTIGLISEQDIIGKIIPQRP